MRRNGQRYVPSFSFTNPISRFAAGSTQNLYGHLVERLGYARNTRHMDGMVRPS